MNNSTAFICQIYKKSSASFDVSQCVIGNIAATLYYYEFGYICIGILAIIVLISIFGGIQQNYRWFILNQAIWDLLKSSEFSCSNYLASYVHPGITRSCYFQFNDSFGPIDWTLYNIIENNISSPLLLLSTTRFIALYFVNFYDKLTQGFRIVFTILIFNFIFILMDIEVLVNSWKGERFAWLIKECQLQQNSTTSPLCSSTNINDFFLNAIIILYNITTYFRVFKPSICLLISIISTSMIILKVGKQAKFQLKHNRRDFFNSLRVAIVITAQTVMNFLIFGIAFIFNFGTLVRLFSSVTIYTIKYTKDIKTYPNVIDFRFPLWIDGAMGLTSKGGQQMITQTRIFIESIIVLSIMTGYREALIKFVNGVYSFIQHPKQFIKNFKPFKSESSQMSWTQNFVR